MALLGGLGGLCGCYCGHDWLVQVNGLVPLTEQYSRYIESLKQDPAKHASLTQHALAMCDPEILIYLRAYVLSLFLSLSLSLSLSVSLSVCISLCVCVMRMYVLFVSGCVWCLNGV